MSAKTIITFAILICVICFNSLIAQITYQTLEQNNAKAVLSTSGTQFKNFSTGESGYTVPKNTGITQLSGLQFWYAGNDVNGQLHGCFGGNDNGTDVFPNNPNEPVIYEVNNADMENFGLGWMLIYSPDSVDGSGYYASSNETYAVVNSWPSCFPFFDRDQDGVYDPNNGDYPIIKGCKAYYMVQNDSQGVHTYSGSEPLGIEMHYLFYQFSDFSYLNDATFVDVCIVNTSTNTYTDFKHSIVLSQETSVDETLFGCDPTKETAYIYSESNGPDSQALGVVNLTYSSSGMQCFQNAATVPEMWANMNGMKSNGQPWEDLNGDNSSFVFSGNPNDANSWNQLSNGDGNVYSRFIINSATGTFLPSQSIFSSYAILYANSGSNLQDVATLLALSDSVHQFNNSHIMDQCHDGMLGISNMPELVEIEIFPNPTSGILNLGNLPQDAAEFQVFDLQGKLIMKGIASQTISVDFIREGSYLLQIRTANGLIQKRFIKN